MRKILVLFTYLSFISVYSQRSLDLVLNINMERNLEFYENTLSEFTKGEDNYNIDLNKLIQNKTHFLSDFNFGNERVFFQENGDFKYIILQKEYEYEEALLEELIDIEYKISKKYGISSAKLEDQIIWNNEPISIKYLIKNKNIYIVFEPLHQSVKSIVESKKQNTKLQDLIISAENGNPESQMTLGMAYYTGNDTPIDKNKARFWIEKSAKHGLSKAQFMIAVMYNKGDGAIMDKEKSFYWFEKSAKRGNVESQFMLGNMYSNGEGIYEDKEEAHRWYQKSANRGQPNAQYQLGINYFFGIGTSVDTSMSVYWMEVVINNDTTAFDDPQNKAKAFWNKYELWKYK